MTRPSPDARVAYRLDVRMLAALVADCERALEEVPDPLLLRSAAHRLAPLRAALVGHQESERDPALPAAERRRLHARLLDTLTAAERLFRALLEASE